MIVEKMFSKTPWIYAAIDHRIEIQRYLSDLSVSFSVSKEEGAGSPTNTLTSIETSASSPIILFSLKRQYLVKFIGWCHNIPSI